MDDFKTRLIEFLVQKRRSILGFGSPTLRKTLVTLRKKNFRTAES